MNKLNSQQENDDLYIYRPGIREVMDKDLKPTMDFELTFEDGEKQMVSSFAIPKPFVTDEQLARNMLVGINAMLQNGHYVTEARLLLRRKRRMRNMIAQLRGGQFMTLSLAT